MKANYSEISEVYDTARSLVKPHIEWWLKRLAEAGELGPGKRLLDLGCGTGRWTIPLVARTGCEAVGIDNSPEMLAKAKAKDPQGRIVWREGDLLAPPVAPQSFDCALLSLILHHLDEPLLAFKAAFNALRPGGVLLVRQGTLEQIIDDTAHRHFPDAITIDRKRTPTRAEVELWLAQAGFTSIEAESVHQRTYAKPEDVVVEAELRVC